MPFGVVSGISRGIGVLIGSGDCRSGMGSFGGRCGASNCNQWDSLCERLFRNYFGISCLGSERESDENWKLTTASCRQLRLKRINKVRHYVISRHFEINSNKIYLVIQFNVE